MTNMYTLLEDEGDTPDQPSPAWLHSEEDVAEAILFLDVLGVAPGKIHPARALQRAEAEYTLGTLDDASASELATFFGCQRVNPSTLAAIKAIIGMHINDQPVLAQQRPVCVRRDRHLAQRVPGLEVDAVRREVQAVHQETRIGASRHNAPGLCLTGIELALPDRHRTGCA